MARQSKEEIESCIPQENTANFRLLLVSLLSAGIGISAGIVAFILYNLIGLFTNLAFYQRSSFLFVSSHFNTLGPLVIVTPVIGGIIVTIIGAPLVAILAGCETASLRSIMGKTTQAGKSDGSARLSLLEVLKMAPAVASPGRRSQEWHAERTGL